MCHFLKTNSKMRMIWAHKRVTTLKLGTAEAFVEKNMQLWTNGIETATPAKNRRFPPNSLIAFFDNFQSSEVNFSSKKFPLYFYLTLLIWNVWNITSVTSSIVEPFDFDVAPVPAPRSRPWWWRLRLQPKIKKNLQYFKSSIFDKNGLEKLNRGICTWQNRVTKL